MSHDSTPQVKYILTTCLTGFFCILFFCFWLPDHINQKAQSLLEAQSDTVSVAQNTDEQVTDELINYIKQNHIEDLSETDTLNEEELVGQFDSIRDEFITSAEQILKTRFKMRELNNTEATPEDFTVPAGLEDVVQFWVHIFGMYDKNHVIFYHQDYVGIVYSVLDFSDLSSDVKGANALKNQMIQDERKRIKKTLKTVTRRFKDAKKNKDGILQVDVGGLSKEEKRIAQMLIKESAYFDFNDKDLIKGLAYRNGFSHRIKKAIEFSGKYFDEMQRIFRERGLPEHLCMIPFVESAFNLSAYSRSGAAGIWQFIEATGKRYLRIDSFTDERYDPILATYAAATHLRNEFGLLKSWPLTVNAYNTGPGRMQQAVKTLETNNITEIIKKFKGSGYGFDSRNYYPEFLAALHVVNNKDYYFGKVEVAAPVEYTYLALPSPMNMKKLAKLSGLSIDEIADNNLGLKPEVLQGDVELPKGYLLKIHPAAKENVLLAMQDLFDEVRYASHHVVASGDTMKKIARHYDVNIKKLAMYNQLLLGEELKPGTIIQLPERTSDVELSLNTPESELVVPDKLQTPVF